jgi:hypothetical protein
MTKQNIAHEFAVTTEKTGFKPNRNQIFGLNKSSGIPVFGISVLFALVGSKSLLG